MAAIRIDNLEVAAIIGVHSYERTQKRKLLIDLVLDYDALKAAVNDDIKQALDYEVLAQEVTKLARRSKCYLLENLAVSLIEMIMTHKQVRKAFVCIKKPKAIPSARSVSFEMLVTRQSRGAFKAENRKNRFG